MRFVWRWTKRLCAIVLILVIGLAAPVVYVETLCGGDATPQPATPLSSETRPEVRTLLTYPEWHIVHAYDDYAEVIRQGDPHDFGYTKVVTGYWSSLCVLTNKSAELGQIDSGTRQLVHVIGVSFTFEMLMKALYEESIGRVVTLLRGSERATLDDVSALQARAYARFLQQVPWYQYDFRADAAALSEASEGSLRDRERALALGLEHGARAAYAGVIAQAVAATGADDLTLQMVVTGLAPERMKDTPGVTVLRGVENGLEVETPRYRELTRILADWAAEGADFVDMAGNDQIMFTATSDTPSHAEAFTSLPRQGYGDTRHLFLVPVADLADTLRQLNGQGLKLEHIHDY